MAQFNIEKKIVVKARKRYVGEDIVTPAMYDGHQMGDGGSYITGLVNGELIETSKCALGFGPVAVKTKILFIFYYT